MFAAQRKPIWVTLPDPLAAVAAVAAVLVVTVAGIALALVAVLRRTAARPTSSTSSPQRALS